MEKEKFDPTMSRISEILGAWYEDPSFLDGDGERSALPLEGARSFTTRALVEHLSGLP
jgi:hypothetical protein